MKKQKLIISFIVILTLFSFITLTNKYNLTVKKYSVIEDVEKIMTQSQQNFYRYGEPQKGDLEKLVKNIEEKSIENTKNKYNINLQKVRTEMIKEDGKTYIVLKANIKNKLLIPEKSINIRAKSEPQLFFDPNSKLRLIED